jgi:hypothetical protein
MSQILELDSPVFLREGGWELGIATLGSQAAVPQEKKSLQRSDQAWPEEAGPVFRRTCSFVFGQMVAAPVFDQALTEGASGAYQPRRAHHFPLGQWREVPGHFQLPD